MSYRCEYRKWAIFMHSKKALLQLLSLAKKNSQSPISDLIHQLFPAFGYYRSSFSVLRKYCRSDKLTIVDLLPPFDDSICVIRGHSHRFLASFSKPYPIWNFLHFNVIHPRKYLNFVRHKYVGCSLIFFFFWLIMIHFSPCQSKIVILLL